MTELKKRASIRIGFVFGMHEVDEKDNVINDHVSNVWGGSYMRLEHEEAVLFEARLNAVCGEDMDALISKARTVAMEFGLETIIGINPTDGVDPDSPGKKR